MRYNHGWTTADEIIANKHKKLFPWDDQVLSIAEIVETDDDQNFKNAHELWLKLKDAFNKEAKHYDPETNMSRLGSIGDKSEREVMRSMWWDFLKAGKAYGEESYDVLTFIIEILYGRMQLETGTILFGS